MEIHLSDEEILDRINNDISLIRRKNGLTFGTDAFLLSSYLRGSSKASLIDLGSGTGILPLFLLKNKKCARAIAIEVQEQFCDLIERNAALNGLSDILSVLHADVRSLPASLTESADIVLSNPPYMKIDSGKKNEHDEKFIARHEVFGEIGDFCAAASKLLKFGGFFYVVYRPDRLSDLMYALKEARLEPKRMTFVAADPLTEPSSVLLEAKKGASSSLVLTRNLFLYKDHENRVESEDILRITETNSFEDFFKKR